MYWTVGLSGGPRRVNHAAVDFGDKVYSFGGYCSGDNYSGDVLIDIYVLDTVTYRWTPLQSNATNTLATGAPYLRYGHTVVAYRGKAYLWGGRNDEKGASAVLHQFDPVTNIWSVVETNGRCPPARDGHSACIIGDSMIIFGGFEEELQRFSQETFAFNFKTLRWTDLRTNGSPPAWRDFHTATAIGQHMYVFGGRSDQLGQYHSSCDVYFDRLKYLDLNDNCWYDAEATGDQPVGRRSHSAWCYRGRLYIFGGFSGTENQHFNDLYEYNPTTHCWRNIHPIGRAPTSRRRQCTVLIGDRVFLFGGTAPYRQNHRMAFEQLQQQLSGGRQLVDLSDLYVLDFAPSLKQLAALAVERYYAPCNSICSLLPIELRNELRLMTSPNRIIGPRSEPFAG